MSQISRRHFLQFAGSTLATIGLSPLIQQQGDRYGRVLAQDTPRKLALIVGINDYPEIGRARALRGCVNDTELQRRLLIHRFGFNPCDILVLTNAQATRKGIIGAFENHLINQAKPGDVVVFHYSGHGSRVFDPDVLVYGVPKGKTGFNSTFVPVDSRLPAEFPKVGGVVKDIMGHTLFLLMSALQTENVTAVLDSCFSGDATRADFIPRSRAGGDNLQISPDEKAYQDEQLSKLKLSRDEFVKLYRAGVAKGVVLAATKTYQTAADAHFNGFYAGAFTYLLTQYLWQQTSTVESAISSIREPLFETYEQSPLADIKPGSGYESQPIFFIDTNKPPAQAAITELTGDRATLWLGGLNKRNLRALKNGTVFTIVDRGNGQVTLNSRTGLVGEATLNGTAEPGALLQKSDSVSTGI